MSEQLKIEGLSENAAKKLASLPSDVQLYYEMQLCELCGVVCDISVVENAICSGGAIACVGCEPELKKQIAELQAGMGAL